MEFIPFNILNERLAPHLENAERFSGQVFNYLKVVQHALVYAENGYANKRFENPWDKPLWQLKAYYRLKGVKQGRGKAVPLKPIVLFDSGRYHQEDGVRKSMYLDRIRQLWPRDQFSHIATRNAELDDLDYQLPEVFPQLPTGKLSANGWRLMADAHGVLHRLREGFSEDVWSYLTTAFHVFFEQFLQYDALLRNRGVKVAVFSTHYHHEGKLAAMKMNRIHAIEYQHGLIAQNDLYYCYPAWIEPVRERALFSDHILLYGSHWRSILQSGHEQPAERLFVAGDYTALAGSVQVPVKPEQHVIAVTAQKNMGSEYVPYLSALAHRLQAEHPDWVLKVKLHPSEKDPQRYDSLRECGVELLGNETNLMQLLGESRIHISIYSTTFFDAVGLDTLNLSIQDYGTSKVYAREMVDTGVALPILFDDDPVAIWKQQRDQHVSFGDRESFYRTFDPIGVKYLVETYL